MDLFATFLCLEEHFKDGSKAYVLLDPIIKREILKT